MTSLRTCTINVLELRSVRGTGGGPEKTILAGAARANRSRFNVTVCYLRDSRDEIFRIDERAKGFEIDYTEIVERHSFDPRIWAPLVRLIRDRQIDIIHGHDYKTDLLAWLLARRTGAVAMATAHGWTGHSSREQRFYYPAHKRLLTRFPRVIAVSTDIRNELVRVGGSIDRVTVLLNGIDPDAFKREPGRREAVRATLGLKASDLVIGTVGRLEPQKRIDLLFESVTRLAPLFKDLRVVVVGDGSLRRPLETQAASLGIAGRCSFLGHRDDIASLHHAFDLYVQSSDYEGTPNSVLEAMAMETPLVATNAGGTAELVTNDVHGLIVPVGDVDRLTAAVEALLKHEPAAQILAAAARHRVESALSFEARTRRLEAIYEELIGEQQRRARGVRQALPHEAPHA